MEEHMKERPGKTVLPKPEQREILKKAKSLVLKDLLPNPKINKILMFGSLVKRTFGKYEKPYKGRTYSDIDILLLVEDDFKVPEKWKLHFESDLYNVYNICKLNGKILIQYMVCRKSSYQNEEHQKEAENWGVPLLLERSRHGYIVLYEREAESI